MMVFTPHHEKKTGAVQYHFMLETSLPFSIISYWKRLLPSGSFHVGNKPSLQAHFILEEAECLKLGRIMVH